MPSSYIQVANGHIIDPFNPDPDKFFIEDIAHSLANQCRFGGHVKKHYSVAEHSVRVSYAVPEEDAFDGLMHDTTEAYLVDIPSPIKNALFGDNYREVEEVLLAKLAAKFDFSPEIPKSVKYADNALLRTEVRDLMWPVAEGEFDLWSPWFIADPLPDTIVPLMPEEAEREFLHRYYELGGKHDDT